MNKSKFVLIIISLCFFCLPFGSFAQTNENSNNIKVSTDTSLRTFDNQYLIGVGDVLDIRIYNRPILSRDTVRVDGRGMIRMPLLEDDIRATCRTDSDLAKEISTKYLEYLRNPHVEVFIKDFQSKPAAVIGEVREPGRFQMQRQVRLLELISFAGGPTDKAGGRIQVKHDTTTQPCQIPKSGENDSTNNAAVANSNESLDKNVSWFELKDLMLSESLSDDENPVIRPGDIVSVIEADKIYVIGNVFNSMTIPLKEPITLSQAIAMAGGTLPNTNLDRIRISRQSKDGKTQTEIIADLKAIKKKQAEDIALQANDVVEVSTSKGKKFIDGLINSIAPGITRLPLRVIP